jgi:uncharacterized protein (DUF433 family)
MELGEYITIEAAIQGGHPVIRGTRMPVQVILGALAGGMSIQEVCEEYYLTEEQVRAALAYASELVDGETVAIVQ